MEHFEPRYQTPQRWSRVNEKQLSVGIKINKCLK